LNNNPYGFSSLIYLAETNAVAPYDPTQIIAKLKAQVQVYPPKLKRAFHSLYPESTLWHAELFVKQDIYNTMGCLTRS
jgi:hypothetical protein